MDKVPTFVAICQVVQRRKQLVAVAPAWALFPADAFCGFFSMFPLLWVVVPSSASFFFGLFLLLFFGVTHGFLLDFTFLAAWLMLGDKLVDVGHKPFQHGVFLAIRDCTLLQNHSVLQLLSFKMFMRFDR